MSDDEVLNLSYKEQWLLAARNGDVSLITDIIQNREDYDVNLDCCGTTKSNLGWTALHLAAYFGHVSVVNLLLKAHVDTDVANNAGDTPLHKAAFTGRQDIVTSLLESGASVSIRNSDGETAEYMTRDPQIKALINAVCVTQKKHEEIRFLHASSIGDIDLINSILQQYRPPNLNCVDERGNTALHNATYRGHCTSVALLLNHGIDTLVKNHRGQLAIEMAPNEQIKQLLRVQPIRPVSRCVDRHEGKLLKKSKLFGWREVYVILERGVLTVFKNSCWKWAIHTRNKSLLDIVMNKGNEGLQNYEMCRYHFEDSMYNTGGRKRLIRNKAIPTKINVPNPPRQHKLRSTIMKKPFQKIIIQ